MWRLALLLLLGWPLQASALTVYYVDPDNSGTRNGGSATPWQSLSDSGAWTAINSALASDDVTVYFSARDAGSDIDETSSIGIHLARTDSSTHVLTLDGMSKYNSNDGTPSWTDYPTRTLSVTLLNGTTVTGYVYNGSRFYVTNGNPIDTTQVINSYITLKGFKLRPTTNQCIWYWLGYHVTVIDNECFRTDAPGVGPGFYFTGQREEIGVDGTGACVPKSYQNCDGFEYLTVQRNYIHETRGEGIYVGGVGDQSSPGVSAKTQNIQIDHNVIVNAAYQAGEGDGIDIKTMVTGVTVQDNFIAFTAAGSGTPRSCLETLSGAVIERNFCDGGGVNVIGFSLSDFWSGVASNRPGSIVRNNVIIGIGGTRAAIHCWGDTTGVDDFTGLSVDNNTIDVPTSSPGVEYGGVYIGTRCTGALVRNNIVYAHRAGSSGLGSFAAYQFAVAPATHSNNIARNTSGTHVVSVSSNYTAATLTTWEATALSSDPLFASTSSPYLPEKYKLQASSPAVDAGVTIGAFAVDFGSNARPFGASWDIGAYEYGADVVAVTSVYRIRMRQ